MILKSPTHVHLQSGRKVLLNLNVYRNLHYRVNAEAKIRYCEEMMGQMYRLKLKHPLELHFMLHRGNRRMGDRANVLTIVEKFFCDALVHYQCIPDDNDKYIKQTIYETGEVCKDDPHVEIHIR